jgi:folate-binding protein YgfZ
MTSTPQSQLTTLLTAAGIAPLSDRAFLRITGPDATRWLNGMVTNSIQTLAPGEGNYNFLLNAQGRIQGDCTIYREGSLSYLLETDAGQLTNIQQLLDKFIIMDDVELTLLENRVGLLLIGPKAPSLLSITDITREDIEPNELVHVTWHSSSLDLMRVHNPLVPRYELWTESLALASIHESLITAGAQELSSEALEAFRILSGTPRFGVDIRDRDLPQETNQTHALHFAKGCYLGQEIVERIHSRGQVHRQFTGFTLHLTDPNVLPTLPIALTVDGKPAGELTSAALIPLPTGPEPLALGYARREALDRNAPLTFEGGTATPASLPFHQIQATIDSPPHASKQIETLTHG